MEAQHKQPILQKRLDSLDVFRGLAIAGMIIVNNPGSWQHMYPVLRHSQWHGCAPADMVFPFFLFIIGTSMAFSFTDHTGQNINPDRKLFFRIIRRSIILFSLGLLLNLLTVLLDSFSDHSSFNLQNLRIMGVLQRISLVYLFAALTVTLLKPSKQWSLFFLILTGYWFLLTRTPLQGHTPGILSAGQNLASLIDRAILTVPHMLNRGAIEPEGLLITLPAYTSVLTGYFTGKWLKERPVKTSTSLLLISFGLVLITAGLLWGIFFPVNKTLWTSSFVFLTGGWAMVLFAVCFETVDVKNWCKHTSFFKVMGLNSIFIYLSAGIISRILLKTVISGDRKDLSVYSWIYKNIFIIFSNQAASSLLFSVTYLILLWSIAYIMYKKQIFIKV